MLVQANISYVGGSLFPSVMRVCFLILLLFLDSGPLGKLMAAKVGMEIVVDVVKEVVTIVL